MDMVSEAINLVQRYQKGDSFRYYVKERVIIVAPLLLVCLVISIALCLGVVAFLDKGAFRAFIAVLLMPVVLLGSLAVQAYLVFSWLELRALKPMVAQGAAPGAKGRLDVLRMRLGKPPPIPWVAVAVFLLLPFVLLVLASVKIAAVVVLLAILTPVVYTHFEAKTF